VIPIATQSEGAAARAATSTVLANFPTEGWFTWTVPTGRTTVTFTVFGASGNVNVIANILNSVGGPGGEARGQFAVRAGEAFEVFVGGSGAHGGFNGGGYPPYPDVDESGRGGGASDVRIGGLGNTCATQQNCSFSDRIVVGGGGGGGGATGNGAVGGGAQGGTAGGRGGVQEGLLYACGTSTYPTFACGADSGGPTYGAGGGGWYGGSPGGSLGGAATDGGGGGSGYVSPLALTGSFPGGTRVGDGRVLITAP
jgi:hypothetical protein